MPADTDDTIDKLKKLNELRKQEHALKRSPETLTEQIRFLRAYASGPTAGVLSKSAEFAGVSLTKHYKWLDSDAVYVDLFKKARRISVAVLEDAVMQRGVEGIDMPVGFHKGKPGAWVKQYSDTLLLSALGARAPELGYNYRRTEITGANGGPVEINITAQPIPLHKLSLQAQTEILAILERELGADEVKALNPAPEEEIDYASDIEAIFGSDFLEKDENGEDRNDRNNRNKVKRDIWDVNDMLLLT